MMKAQAPPNMALNGKKYPYKSLHNLRIACRLLQGTQFAVSNGELRLGILFKKYQV
jgi:hypothetical protein